MDADPDWQRACGLDHALELAVVLADCLDRAPGNPDLHLAPGRAREIVVALADDLDVDPDLARQLGRDPDLALGRALELDLSDEQGRCTPEAVHDALALLSGGPHPP